MKESFDAIRQAIGRGNTEKVANILRLSHSLVSKWQEPHSETSDSGAFNPCDRVKDIVVTAQKIGRNRKDALAPVLWLNREVGVITVDLPKTEGTLKEIEKAMLKTIKEFADLTQAYAKTLEKDITLQHEREEVFREGWECIEEIATFIYMVKEHKEPAG